MAVCSMGLWRGKPKLQSSEGVCLFSCCNMWRNLSRSVGGEVEGLCCQFEGAQCSGLVRRGADYPNSPARTGSSSFRAALGMNLPQSLPFH